MLQIAGFLQAAVDAGTISREVHPWYTAEYILTSASGVIFTWLTFSDTGSATETMRRLLPVAFRAITDEDICTD